MLSERGTCPMLPERCLRMKLQRLHFVPTTRPRAKLKDCRVAQVFSHWPSAGAVVLGTEFPSKPGRSSHGILQSRRRRIRSTKHEPRLPPELFKSSEVGRGDYSFLIIVVLEPVVRSLQTVTVLIRFSASTLAPNGVPMTTPTLGSGFSVTILHPSCSDFERCNTRPPARERQLRLCRLPG